MPDGDTVRALDHPYRRSILRVLQKERMTYSDLFSRLEPDGGERARFNYHLRSLRNADLVRITDSIYGLTPGGEAALVLLREVSERAEAQPRPTRESRTGEGGWVRRVGDALRLRTDEGNAIVPVGRVLLLVGSALLLVSLFLPWFTVTYGASGMGVLWSVSSHDLLPGTVNGLRAIEAIGFWGGFVYVAAAFLWLLLIVVIGVTSALVDRRFSWFGVSGILVLALTAVQMFFVAGSRGFYLTPGTPSVGFLYGFILAVIGSALIETGARLKTPGARVALMRTPLPLGILLTGFGIALTLGGLSSPNQPGMLIVGLGFGIPSTVGGFFALRSPTKAPPSPGVLLMVLGFVFAVTGFYGVLYLYVPLFEVGFVATFLGLLMFLVGMVLRAKPSMASRPAQPSVSP